MFNSIFDMDKPFWNWVGKIPEIILLSVFWFVCSLPLITVIPASCALYDAVSRCLMTDMRGCYTRFFRTFWKELKQGIPLNLLALVFAVIGYFGDGILQSSATDSSAAAVFLVIYRVLLLTPLGLLCWLVPLQSRYYNPIGVLLTNAFRMSIGMFPKTLLLLAIPLVGFTLCSLHTATTFLFLVLPCVVTIFQSILVENSFMKLFPNDYDDDGYLIQSVNATATE